VRIIRATIFSAYMTVCVVALILGPLIVLHGYRAWWLDVADGVLACAVVGGNIAHYRTARRNGHSAPQGHDEAAHPA
jgi:hypothetical protein